MLDRERITAQLNSDRYVQGLILGDCADSTNSNVREMAQHGAAEGITMVVERQTAGRGRRGRVFHSPEGGLYLSTLIRPKESVDPGLITCRAAVAAARAIESLCHLSIDIKWVNDLYLNGRKLAGILAEGVLSPDGKLTAVVVGIGINLTGTLPQELATIATTLEAEGVTLSREDVAAAFLNQWEAVQDDPGFMEEYRRRNLVLGREVTVVRGGDTYAATAIEITDNGHLVVETADGKKELTSGEVSLRL